MELKFVSGEPALLAGSTLAVSDLHIGIEREYRLRGLRMPSQTQKMGKRLEFLLKKTRAKSLVICGDLKHKVPGISWQEEREIPALLEGLLKKAKIHIVPGNHDADLKPLLPNGVELHSSTGFLRDGVYFTHGHTWPDPLFLEADWLVAGHIQPQVEIRDRLGYVWREHVWMRAGLDGKSTIEKYGPRADAKPAKLPELIILPSFNQISGGLALNRKEKARESPLLKLAKMKTARLFLLDGTYLGQLGKL